MIFLGGPGNILFSEGNWNSGGDLKFLIGPRNLVQTMEPFLPAVLYSLVKCKIGKVWTPFFKVFVTKIIFSDRLDNLERGLIPLFLITL